MEFLPQIKWLWVVVATVVGFGLGAVWFNPNVFGKMWMDDLGFTADGPKGNFALIMGTTFLTTFFSAFCLAWLIEITRAVSLIGGLKVGLLVGVGFVMTSYISDQLFEQRRPRVIALTSIHRALMFAIMGAILGNWGK